MNITQKARARNHLKMRISGSYLHGTCGFSDSVLTKRELKLIHEINSLKDKLLNQFDINSAKLGFNVYRYKITTKHEGVVIYMRATKQIARMYRGDKNFIIKRIKL